MNLNDWFRDVYKQSGLSQRELAKRLSAVMGKPFMFTQVNKVLKGTRVLKYEEAVTVAKLLKVPLPMLGISATVPVVGGIRNGGKVILYKEAQDFIPAPPDGETDTIALEVSGTNAALGIAYDGWVVLFRGHGEQPSEEHIGKAVLAVLHDGTRYVRVLERGTRDSLYSLRSSMMGEPSVIDAPIIQIHRMLWVRPR